MVKKNKDSRLKDLKPYEYKGYKIDVYKYYNPYADKNKKLLYGFNTTYKDSMGRIQETFYTNNVEKAKKKFNDYLLNKTDPERVRKINEKKRKKKEKRKKEYREHLKNLKSYKYLGEQIKLNKSKRDGKTVYGFEIWYKGNKWSQGKILTNDVYDAKKKISHIIKDDQDPESGRRGFKPPIKGLVDWKERS